MRDEPHVHEHCRVNMEKTLSMATGVAERGRVVDHTFARNGEPIAPRLSWFVDGIATAMSEDRYTEIDTPGPEVQVVLHQLDAREPAAVPAQERSDLRRRHRRARRAADRPPPHRVSPVGSRAREPCGPTERRARRSGRVVRHTRTGHVHGRARGRRREVLRRGRRADRAAGLVPARDRERVRPRPRARAVGRRRTNCADRTRR